MGDLIGELIAAAIDIVFGHLFRESPSFRLGLYVTITVVVICLVLTQVIQPDEETVSFWVLLVLASPFVAALLTGVFALLNTPDQEGTQKYIHFIAVCAVAVAAIMLIFLTGFRIRR